MVGDKQKVVTQADTSLPLSISFTHIISLGSSATESRGTSYTYSSQQNVSLTTLDPTELGLLLKCPLSQLDNECLVSHATALTPQQPNFIGHKYDCKEPMSSFEYEPAPR